MSTHFITIEQLRSVLDEKLSPLSNEITELRGKLDETMSFLDMANERYEEVLSKLNQHEVEGREIIAENKILKGAVRKLYKIFRHLY